MPQAVFCSTDPRNLSYYCTKLYFVKRYNHLIALFAVLLLPAMASAQFTSWHIFPINDGYSCGTILQIVVSTGPQPEENFDLHVDWGDGTDYTTEYNAAANLDSVAIMGLGHPYPVSGPYTITVELTGGNGTPMGTLTTVHQHFNHCASVIINTTNVETNATESGVPYDFTDVNGMVTTLYSNPYNDPNWGMEWRYLGLDPTLVPYTASVNDTWLTNNGMSQLTPDLTFNSLPAENLTLQEMSIGCSTPALNPNFEVVSLVAGSFVAPLETGTLFLSFANRACLDTSDVTVSLTMPQDFVPDVTGLTNASVAGNVLTFDVNDVSGFVQQTIGFTFPGNTPAGTTINFAAELLHPADTDTSDNSATATGEVLNSYDPNEKVVSRDSIIDPSATEELTYVVHFQNDGNLQAYHIVIRDTISENLDLSSLQVTGFSDHVATTVDPATREVVFRFQSIYLPPSSAGLEASQGYVVYKILEIAGLGEGDEIENTAYIYFDFNPPIVTNTTYNINLTPTPDLSVNEMDGETLSLYPNPATDAIRFNGAEVLSAKVYDLAGKLIVDAAVNGNELSVAGLSNGVYQVMIATAKGVHAQKLVVKK